MKVLKLIVLVFAVGVVACEGTIELGEDTVMPGPSTSGGPKADSVGDTPVTLNGGALYQQHCGSCHGADATGGIVYSDSILGFPSIEPIVRNGLGTMPAIAIEAAQINAIQTFLSGPSAPDPVVTPPDGATPALQVFAAECSSCHGAEGTGTNLGPTLRLKDAGLTRYTVRQGRNGPNNPTTMPIYDDSMLDDPALDEIVAWLDAFPNPTDGEGLFNQFCSTCHGVDGAGGTSFKPVAGTLRAQTIIRTGHGAQRYNVRSEYMPAWTPEQISDEEIVLIERYMRAM